MRLKGTFLLGPIRIPAPVGPRRNVDELAYAARTIVSWFGRVDADQGTGWAATEGAGGDGYKIAIGGSPCSLIFDDPRWAELYSACVCFRRTGLLRPQLHRALCGGRQGRPGLQGLPLRPLCLQLRSTKPDRGHLRDGGLWPARDPLWRPHPPARSGHPVGDYLARAAEFEAESVPAFGRLVRSLATHGAARCTHASCFTSTPGVPP